MKEDQHTIPKKKAGKPRRINRQVVLVSSQIRQLDREKSQNLNVMIILLWYVVNVVLKELIIENSLVCNWALYMYVPDLFFIE